MADVFIEDALATIIGGLAAVQAIRPDMPIRPFKLAQSDNLNCGPAVIIAPQTEEHANDLSGRGGLVEWIGFIRCVALKFHDCRRLAEAIRSNDTDPGTGLAGFNLVEYGPVIVPLADGTGTAEFEIDVATYDKKDFAFIFQTDGSDAGDYVIDATLTCNYRETK
jgi:hypothetical protein